MRACGLNVEYRTGADVVVGVSRPRFGWRLDEAGVQTAYRVEVVCRGAVLWDTGKVSSSRMVGIEYEGAPLKASELVHWRVKVWDGNDAEGEWSEEARFRMALLEEWCATWIRGADETRLAGGGEVNEPAFQKDFVVKSHLVSAVLHVTGVGYYEAWLNGSKVGNKVLDPSPTAYDHTVLYSTYDVTAALREGENRMEVLLGHGLYEVLAKDTWDFEKAPWRGAPRMIAQLELEYADGTRERVVSDGTWRQVESPISFDAFREGEIFGGRYPNAVDLSSKTVLAQEVPGPGGVLKASPQPGAKVVREIKPKAIHAVGDGFMVEFSENMAGWIRIRLHGLKAGEVVSMRYDERVGTDWAPVEKRFIDSFYHESASKKICAQDVGFQTNRFISSGAAEEVYEPRFTYNGFQYVWIRGLHEAPSLDDIIGCVVRTDFALIGSFRCSDPTWNSLMAMGERSYCANYADGIPTDCPHREKNGWTGDASIASELAQYLAENTAGYEKWLGDIIDAQNQAGDLPGIVPSAGWGFDWGNGPAWDSALPVIAWNLYLYRGDTRILHTIWPTLQKYLAFTASKADPNGVVKHGLGDWIPVHPEHAPDTAFTSSCYFYQAQRIGAEIARLLHLPEEAARLDAAAAHTRQGIRSTFAHDHGLYANGGQTAQAMALAFGIVDDAERPDAQRALIAAVEAADTHIDTGILGTKHLLRALSLAGRSDLAFRLWSNPTAPSPVEWLQKGSTTLWEDWGDGYSRNHIMFGDYVAWSYQFLAGIQLNTLPGSTPAVPLSNGLGFQQLLIAPQPIPELTSVEASVQSLVGTISSSWHRTPQSIEFHITIPPNASAILRLPGQNDESLPPGSHTRTLPQ